MIGNYWNSAYRNLMKRKKFSFINVFGLAIGMASALLILTYVTFEFSFDVDWTGILEPFSAVSLGQCPIS